MRRLAVLFLAGLLLADEPALPDLEQARKVMESRLEAAKALRAKGDVAGAEKEQREAVRACDAVLAEVTRLAASRTAALLDSKARVQERYLAAVQLGRLKAKEGVPALAKALENDASEVVRRAAAWSLGQMPRYAADAAPVLIRNVGGERPYVGWMCDRALGEIARTLFDETPSMGFDLKGSADERRAAQERWRLWWKDKNAR